MPDKTRLVAALDNINERYGKGTMKIASAGLAGKRREWSMRQERRTLDFTRFDRHISTSSSKLLEYQRAQLV